MLPADVRRELQRQSGVVTRPQLLRLGCTAGTIDGWVRRGTLECSPVQDTRLAGTYRVPGGGVPHDQHLVAAALRCRPRAWIAGAAVLGLLGFEGFSVADPFVVLVPAGRWISNVPFPVVVDPWCDRHRARCRPVPVAAPTRSLVEAARTIGGKRLRAAVDYAQWKKLTDRARPARVRDLPLVRSTPPSSSR